MKKSTSLLLILIGILWLFSCETNQNKTTSNPKMEEAITNDPNQTSSKSSESSQQPIERLYTYGIDISKFQGDEVEFLNKAKDSLSFVICKATEGITYTDPDFKFNWNMISKERFIKGSYHFYRSNDDPKKQVNNYLNAISDLQKIDLPPIVDFERGGIEQSQSVELIQSNLLIFLKTIEEKLNRKPLIYTDNSIGNKYLNDARFSDYTLWIAAYENRTSPNQPGIWKDKKWIFWQKSSSYKIGTRINDFDIFNGKKDDLIDFIKNY